MAEWAVRSVYVLGLEVVLGWAWPIFGLSSTRFELLF